MRGITHFFLTNTIIYTGTIVAVLISDKFYESVLVYYNYRVNSNLHRSLKAPASRPGSRHMAALGEATCWRPADQ